MTRIPNILHWAAFGGLALSPLNAFCMESWARVLPEFAVMAWNDENAPRRRWLQRAIRESPINAHNYMGVYALWKYGGIMLDNDVEIVQPIDLDCGMFIGFQRSDTRTESINNAVMGAVPGHPLIRRVLQRMELRRPTDDPVWMGPGMLTAELYAMGLKGLNEEQMVGDVRVYAKDRFYPVWYTEKLDRSKLTPRTLAIHWWESTWGKRRPEAHKA